MLACICARFLFCVSFAWERMVVQLGLLQQARACALQQAHACARFKSANVPLISVRDCLARPPPQSRRKETARNGALPARIAGFSLV